MSPPDLLYAIRDFREGPLGIANIKKLLNRVADINEIINVFYGTALGVAVYNGSETNVSLLLRRGADINVVGGEFGTALGMAVYKEREEIISLLLDRGADINVVGGKYGTALGVAAFFRSEKIVSLLLDRGADIQVSFVEGVDRE